MPDKRKLTLKQERFAREYIKEGNASEAVRRAYPNVKTPLSVRVVGSENLTKPNIRERIDELLAEEMSKREVASILSRNIRQNKNLGASNSAIELYARMTPDMLQASKSVRLNLNLSPEQRAERIKEIVEQIQALQGTSNGALENKNRGESENEAQERNKGKGKGEARV
jgi:phage terminase small subunit